MNHGTMPTRAFARWLLALLLALAAGPLLAQSAGARITEHAKTGFPLTGMHTNARCEDCHQQGVFQGTPRDCASCHVRGARLAGSNVVMGPQHVPTRATCETCHNTVTFAGARFNHMGVTRDQCGQCHNGIMATGKPNTPVHAGVTTNCGDCHRSTTNWTSARPDHSLFNAATNCATCHNGSTATGKKAGHMPTTANCIACHTVATWKPSTWNHTQQPVANQCSSCHNGSTASGKTANHIPYQTLTGVAIGNCDACHRAGYANWAPGYFHRYVTVTNQCSLCHLNGGYSLTAKPNTPTHAGVTGSCENCHRSTSNWLSVTYVHPPQNAVGTGSCDSCHLGQVNAVTKTATHIPVPAGTAKCDACHLSQVSFATSVTMNHAAVATAACSSCHNGMYASQGRQGALAKPANHIPEAQLLNGAGMDCKACHTSTASWTSERMDHNGSMGNGAGWCKSCHQTGTSYLGTMQRMSLNHNGGSAVKTDCSQSGCHRPLGNTGSTFVKWK